MKTALLLGDSIRLNYMPMVYRLLDGKANVVGPEDNCRFSKYTLFNIPDWLEQFGPVDIIHWNNGLWDVSHHARPQGECLTSEVEYARDIQKILALLKATGAKIIFATSTPVRDQSDTFNNPDIVRYNEIATRIMNENGIEINDLHNFVLPHVDEYINDEDNVHLNKDGVKNVGAQVAQVIEKYL